MPLVAIICFTFIYLGFPTYDYYFDGITFAIAVESVEAGAPAGRLLHPHHLLYSPMALGACKLVWGLGLNVKAWLIMHCLSSIFALAGLWFFRLLAREMRLPDGLAVAGMCLLGSSYAYWHYGTNGETTAPVTAALIALLLLSSRHLNSPTKRSGIVIMGIVQAGAALVHQSAIVFLPVVLWAIWHGSPKKRRTRDCMLFTTVSLGATAVCYLVAGVTLLHLRSPGELLAWGLGYFGPDPRTGYAVSYFSLGWNSIPASVRGWIECWTGYWIHDPRTPDHGVLRWIWLALAGSSILAIIASIAGALLPLPARLKHLRKLRTLLLWWVGLHAAFFLWWKPGAHRFWLMALPASCALALLGAMALSIRARASRSFPSIFVGTIAGAIALTVLTGAFRHEIIPACNRPLKIARALAAHTEPQALIVLSGVGRYTALKAYVEYFAQRRMLILDWQFSDKTRSPNENLLLLHNRLALAKIHRTVYVLSEALSQNLDEHFIRHHGVSGRDRRSALSSTRLEHVAELEPGLNLLKLN